MPIGLDYYFHLNTEFSLRITDNGRTLFRRCGETAIMPAHIQQICASSTKVCASFFLSIAGWLARCRFTPSPERPLFRTNFYEGHIRHG
jgi:hypothetical protein